MINGPTRWTLVEGPAFLESVHQITPDVKYFDTMMETITWTIARGADDPLVCPETEPPLRRARMELPWETPSILAVYFILDLPSRSAILQMAELQRGYLKPEDVEADWWTVMGLSNDDFGPYPSQE
ncbi:hypothetical protein ACFFKU_06760 [Kineococcus gynurae]|uniref:Uncharacterized protein n=1 Tax=Kineococcus gynurae TaxID=452979 RepID=A0ABV5LWZ5_9ACTN